MKYSFNDTSEGDQHVDWHVGLVFFCSSRLPGDGTAVLKHVRIRYLSWVVSFVFSCILLSAFVGWYSLSLRLIKQHMGDHRFRNNGEVEITVREWLRMQGPDFCSDGIFKTRPQRGKMHQRARELRWKMMILNGLSFNVVMTSQSIFVAWGRACQHSALEESIGNSQPPE